eukprot:TRINITY_DN14203_c0_g2_i1.p1 TRINITY_DN14203_c0_g2~~TRINITY_DN14203_c0_g2_i1.p1  ORF type:complete len:764 (+),score=201.43 TRINITY_DN14203_c0_g2_i1:127-2418(+)
MPGPGGPDYLRWDEGRGRWIWNATTRERTDQTHERHRAALAKAPRGQVRVLCIGDSMFERFTTTGTRCADVLNSLGVCLAGVGGDGVQHCLWRVEQGLLEECPPSVHTVVLFIGTNNVDPNKAEQVADGILQVAETIAQRQAARVAADPEAIPVQLLLHTLLPHRDLYRPRAEWTDAECARRVRALNTRVCEINRLVRQRVQASNEFDYPFLSSLRQLNMVHFATQLTVLLSREGGLGAAGEYYEDHVHLNQLGYAHFARLLAAELLSMWPGGNPPAEVAQRLRTLALPSPQSAPPGPCTAPPAAAGPPARGRAAQRAGAAPPAAAPAPFAQVLMRKQPQRPPATTAAMVAAAPAVAAPRPPQIVVGGAVPRPAGAPAAGAASRGREARAQQPARRSRSQPAPAEQQRSRSVPPQPVRPPQPRAPQGGEVVAMVPCRHGCGRTFHPKEVENRELHEKGVCERIRGAPSARRRRGRDRDRSRGRTPGALMGPRALSVPRIPGPRSLSVGRAPAAAFPPLPQQQQQPAQRGDSCFVALSAQPRPARRPAQPAGGSPRGCVPTAVQPAAAPRESPAQHAPPPGAAHPGVIGGARGSVPRAVASPTSSGGAAAAASPPRSAERHPPPPAEAEESSSEGGGALAPQCAAESELLLPADLGMQGGGVAQYDDAADFPAAPPVPQQRRSRSTGARPAAERSERPAEHDGPPPLKSWASVAAKPQKERWGDISGLLPGEGARLRGLRTAQGQQVPARKAKKGDQKEDEDIE